MKLLQVILFFVVGIMVVSCGEDPSSPPNIDPHNVSKIVLGYINLPTEKDPFGGHEEIEMKQEVFQSFCEELSSASPVQPTTHENDCYDITITLTDKTEISLLGKGRIFRNPRNGEFFFETHNSLVEKYWNI